MTRKTIWLMIILLFLCMPSGFAENETRTVQLDETTRRVEYVDGQGNLTVGSDRYAYSIQTLDEAGNPIREFYFDLAGEPCAVKAGYYGVARTYNKKNQCVQYDYLDADGNLMLNTSEYAILKRTYDAAGHAVLDTYYDVEGKPVALWGGQYGMRRDAFNEQGHCVEYTYVDINGEPMEITSGYSTVKCICDEKGRAKVNMYYGLDGQLVKVDGGYYGDLREYDAQGQNISITYLDQEGQPMVSASGYATVRKEYIDGDVSVEWYYDLAGNPVEVRKGQYGAKYVYQDGKLQEKVAINLEGQEVFLLDKQLAKHPALIVLGAAGVMILSALLPRKLRWGLLALYVLFIVYITLYVRTSNEHFAVSFELFRSYQDFLSNADTRAQIVNNILLFVPFGFILYQLIPSGKTILASVLFSVLIEAAQWFFGMGWCEVDDVLSNGLGGGIGMLLAAASERIRQSTIWQSIGKKRRAGR